MGHRPRNLTGQRFHKLVVLEFAGFRQLSRCRKSLWKCRCDCGAEPIVAQVALTAGTTKSCGCIVGKHKKTHGGTGTPEFMAWTAMLQRCRNPKSTGFERWGGRGISVCERWNSFDNFLADMGPRPSPAHSIDRKLNDGNYEPGNCRWVTPVVQSNNRRSSRYLTINGETKTLAQWEAHAGLKPGIIFRRLRAGWKAEDTIIPPLSRARHAAATLSNSRPTLRIKST